MAHNTPITTENETLEEILSNGKQYIVPKFQRDYSWEQEHWEILWEDIENIIHNIDEYHYMGYIVLQQGKEKKQFTIVDGQQRLTTFSLLALTAIKKFHDMKDESSAKTFFTTFIGSEESTYFASKNKLTLNKNNKRYYEQVVNFYKENAQEKPPIHKRRKKQTILLMGKALEYFSNKMKTLTGEQVATLLKTIGEKLLFTTIFIQDELNAYKIFETLNARGVQLSSSDLLKNYIFSEIDKDNTIEDEALETLEETWETIGANIGKQKYSEYILTEWNSEHSPLTRNEKLFANVRKEIVGEKKAEAYIKTLESNSSIYGGLFEHEHDIWKEFPDYKQIKEDIRVLNLFGIKQSMSVLLSSYKHYDKQEFARILHWIVIFSVRYNVICRLHSNEQERLYNTICKKIKTQCKSTEIKKTIVETLYPNDKTFIDAFSEKSLPTEQSHKKARYLLWALSKTMGDTTLDEASFTVEHILPLNANEAWQEYFGEHWNMFKQRLGNMALVPASVNQELEQKPFKEKQEILAQKNICQLNTSIGNCPEWTTDTITSRQKKLAEIAKTTWKIH